MARGALEAIRKAAEAGRMPILVGGTGLYFRALLGGLADTPPVPEEARAAAQKLYDQIGEEKFRREFAKLDPASATKLAKNDRQRLVRAYEVARHTGRTLGQWQKGTGNRGQGISLFPIPCSLSPESTTRPRRSNSLKWQAFRQGEHVPPGKRPARRDRDSDLLPEHRGGVGSARRTNSDCRTPICGEDSWVCAQDWIDAETKTLLMNASEQLPLSEGGTGSPP